MHFLLDTHVLIWALGSPGRLDARTRAVLEDDGNSVSFSAVSIWEIAIKFRLGRTDFQVRCGRDRPGGEGGRLHRACR